MAVFTQKIRCTLWVFECLSVDVDPIWVWVIALWHKTLLYNREKEALKKSMMNEIDVQIFQKGFFFKKKVKS